MHKHYIRVNENNEVINAFCDAFETPLESDILYCDTETKEVKEPRHTHLCCVELFPLQDEQGNWLNKYVNKEIIRQEYGG